MEVCKIYEFLRGLVFLYNYEQKTHFMHKNFRNPLFLCELIDFN